MNKYYLRLKPQLNGTNAVHKENCPFLDESSKKIFLGEFFSSQDAISEAKRYSAHSKGCLFCTKELMPIKKQIFLEWNMFSVS
jgi:hypothetical protein